MDELNNLAMSALAITQIGFSFFALPLLLVRILPQPPAWSARLLLALNLSMAISTLPELIVVISYIIYFIQATPEEQANMVAYGLGFPVTISLLIARVVLSTLFFWHRFRSRFRLSLLLVLALQGGNMIMWLRTGYFSWDIVPWGYAPFLPGKGLSLLLNLGLLYLCYSYLKNRGELEVQDGGAEGRRQLEHLLSEEQTQQP